MRRNLTNFNARRLRDIRPRLGKHPFSGPAAVDTLPRFLTTPVHEGEGRKRSGFCEM